VSGHLKILREAGVVQPRRAGGRTVFVGSRKRIERLLEGARATTCAGSTIGDGLVTRGGQLSIRTMVLGVSVKTV
jgi:DNA-binding transcriptional ArsR family regulator